MKNKDDLFVDLVTKGKFLSRDKLDEARHLHHALHQNGYDFTFPEVLIQKEFLNSDQVRMLNVLMYYEKSRQDDEELGEFIVQRGFLSVGKVRQCLDTQTEHYQEGRPFERLADYLARKGYISPEQLLAIETAFEKERGSKTARVTRPKQIPVRPPTRRTLYQKPLDKGLSLPTLKVSIRRTRVKGPTGDIHAQLIIPEGTLDGETFKEFKNFAITAADLRSPYLVINGNGLEYVSSAGIGAFVEISQQCKGAEGALHLCNLPDKVKKVMLALDLSTILNHFTSERDALTSFSAS